jgi:hypothetical protein
MSRFYQHSQPNNPPSRSKTEADAIIAIVVEAVETMMVAHDPFTALDVSNHLKSRNFPVRHREVAGVVRALHESGEMARFDYDRFLVDVMVDNGQNHSQAYVYLHQSQTIHDYQNCAQDALPPVPHDRARSLEDVVPAGIDLSPMAQAAKQAMMTPGVSANAYGSPSHRSRSCNPFRQDGALAVPKKLVEQAGFQEGDLLILEVDTPTGSLRLAAASRAPSGTPGPIVRVWADLRVRIAKTKLRIATGTHFAVASNPPSSPSKPNISVATDGELRIEP